eukprot:5775226-Alexandrium_andersonii.AAC.1
MMVGGPCCWIVALLVLQSGGGCHSSSGNKQDYVFDQCREGGCVLPLPWEPAASAAALRVSTLVPEVQTGTAWCTTGTEHGNRTRYADLVAAADAQAPNCSWNCTEIWGALLVGFLLACGRVARLALKWETAELQAIAQELGDRIGNEIVGADSSLAKTYLAIGGRL